MPAEFHVGLRGLGDRARVTVVGLAAGRVVDVAEDVQHRLRRERVQHGGRGVRHQGHVGFVDRLPAGDRGTVEHDAIGEGLFLDGADVLRGMVHLAARVGEAKVDVLDVVFLDQVEDLADVRHASESVFYG